MTENEFHNRRRVDQTVRMVTDAGLGDDLNIAPKGTVAGGEDIRIVGHGHDVIRISHNMKQGNAGLREWFESIDGIAGEVFRFSFGEAVDR